MGLTAAAKAIMWDALLSGGLYVSLHTADPGSNGANELSGNGYARPLVEFAAAGGDGIAENSNPETYGPATTADWAEATHFGLWTAATEGTFRGGFALSEPVTVGVGDTATFGAGALVATLTDPA